MKYDCEQNVEINGNHKVIAGRDFFISKSENKKKHLEVNTFLVILHL